MNEPKIVERINCTCQSDPLGRCVVHLGEWRPIETAPKDGAYLIANRLTGNVTACHVRSDGMRMIDGPSFTWGWGEVATHWMPRPDPPEDK